MKKVIISMLLAVLACVVALAGDAETTDGSAQKIIRFDVSEEEYYAKVKPFFDALEANPERQDSLDSFPLLPASVLGMVEEFRNNSSSLEETESGIIWNTGAAKIIWDERLQGVSLWAEAGEEMTRVDIGEDCIDGRNGCIRIPRQDSLSLNGIRTLNIYFGTNAWMGDWGNACYQLTYDVESGKIVHGQLETIMEYSGYTMDWSLGRYGDDNRLELGVLCENLADDFYYSISFDVETGESYLK